MCPYLLNQGSQGDGIILPKKYLESVSPEYYESHPVGSGPYKFLEKREGDYIKYVAQDRHWRVGTPKYKYLTFIKLPEEGTREAGLRSGEVDLIQVGISRVDKLEAEGFVIHEMKGAVNMVLDFLRTYEPGNPLGKKEVRQALVYAIDKAAILQHILMGRGSLIGHVYQMNNWSISYKEYPVTPYDPKTAKELLADAGYPNGFTIHLYSFVTLVPEQKLVNEAIAGYWEAIGMDVKIIELDAGAFFPIWMKKKEPVGPSAHVHSWASRLTDPWSMLYHSDVEKHIFSQTKDLIMDQLIEKYQGASNIQEYIEAERACTERSLEMFYKSGIASTNIFFVSRKGIPKWEMGRGKDSYRFEYLGATK
jgi:peptide/nickel transport system substrate-binding protein